jgi:HK97 family phage major capsid protein
VFEADEAGDTAEAEPALILTQEVNLMDEAKKVLAEPEPEPEPIPEPEPKAAYRATFAIKKETVGEPADNGKKETWEYCWHLRHGQYMPQDKRVLEESEAAEGGPFVPADMLNQIMAQRNEMSLVSRAGMMRYQTDKLIYNIPREVTAMTRLAAIAEEGAYVANEAAFGTLAITVVKYGSMITTTEELEEDQNLFMPWFITACARAWAMAENAEMYTAADVAGNGTVGVAGSDTLTLAEFNTMLYYMATPYRDKAAIVCHPGTMAAIAGLLVATPYAFGAYPDVQRNPLGLPSINGMPVHLCSDWLLYTAAAALGCVMSIANTDLCGIVERRGLKIKVDPYGDSLNGRIRYFPSARFAPFFSQPLAHIVKNGI